MNDLNHLEKQLLSWKPRPPSASLKRRLFQKTSLELPAVPAFAIGRWLAPAMAVFVLACVYVGINPEYSTGSSPSVGLIATVTLHQPNLGVCYASAAPNERNIWTSTSFEWTNAGQSLSTPRPVWRRNDLMH